MGIESSTEEVVVGVGCHHCLGEVGFAVEDGAVGVEQVDEIGVCGCGWSGEEGDVTDCCLGTFDVERVLFFIESIPNDHWIERMLLGSILQENTYRNDYKPSD